MDLQALNKTIQNMKNKIFGTGILVAGILAISIPSFASAATLNRELQFGMSGTDVSAVQTFLATDRALYPQGMVTGYFGSFTKSAVTNFQLRNEIPAVGRIGPMTLPIINLQMSTGMYMGMSYAGVPTGVYSGGDVNAPILSNLGINTANTSAVVAWNTNELATGVVYYSTSPLNVSESMTSVSASGNKAMTDSSLRTSQSIAIAGLQAGTTYYYLVYTTDASGNVTITWPSTFQTKN